MDRRLWPTQKSIDERAKHLYYSQQHQNPVSHPHNALPTYLLTWLITFRVSRRPREMCSGHVYVSVCLSACQPVCLSVCLQPQAHTTAWTRM